MAKPKSVTFTKREEKPRVLKGKWTPATGREAYSRKVISVQFLKVEYLDYRERLHIVDMAGFLAWVRKNNATCDRAEPLPGSIIRVPKVP